MAYGLPCFLIATVIALFIAIFLIADISELYPKWLIIYPGFNKFFVGVLLAIYSVLTPGLALLIFAVFAALRLHGKKLLLTGLSLLVYYPIHLASSYVLGSMYPIFLVFQAFEIFLLLCFWKFFKPPVLDGALSH